MLHLRLFPLSCHPSFFKLELEEQERYFNKLERKEEMENKMKAVMELKVKVVKCKKVSKCACIGPYVMHQEEQGWCRSLRFSVVSIS